MTIPQLMRLIGEYKSLKDDVLHRHAELESMLAVDGGFIVFRSNGLACDMYHKDLIEAARTKIKDGMEMDRQRLAELEAKLTKIAEGFSYE